MGNFFIALISFKVPKISVFMILSSIGRIFFFFAGNVTQSQKEYNMHEKNAQEPFELPLRTIYISVLALPF